MTQSTAKIIRIGTRASPLALAQSEQVREALLAAHPELEAEQVVLIPMKTTGDNIQSRKLEDIGGKGLFTKEIEEALLDGRVDMAVHSMKDMPTQLPNGLEIKCVLQREDARDAFISPHAASLEALPHGARFGTASLRRGAQILHLRPDMKLVPLRGNVETRLRKLNEGECDATMLAMAGLNRLDMAHVATLALPVDTCLPAVAQGAVGVETRAGDAEINRLLHALNHVPTLTAITAERAMLEMLDGSCRTPIAAYATLDGDNMHLDGLIAKPDGSVTHRNQTNGLVRNLSEAYELGAELGAKLKALAGPRFLQ